MPCNPGNLHAQQGCYRAMFINKRAISTPPLPTGSYFRCYVIPRVLPAQAYLLILPVGLEECSLKCLNNLDTYVQIIEQPGQ